MAFWTCLVLTTLAAACFVVHHVLLYRQANERHYAPLPNGQRIEVDPDDETDPMHDPDVRAMLAEVIRTGRPMTMNSGEAPRFIDDDLCSATPLADQPEKRGE